jgi:hypothetical protein
MSLLTGPLDYTAATTQSVLKGIDTAVAYAVNDAALFRKEQERTQQRIAGIEDGMSKLKGSAETLTPRQRQVFGSYYSGYKQLIDQYAQDPSQDNMNKINQVIGGLESYLNSSKGQYLSDKKSYAEVLTDPTRSIENVDEVTSRMNIRHGENGLFDQVEFDPETLSVRVVDKSFGIGEKLPVQEHPLYNPTSDQVLLYTPKQDTPKFIPSIEYGASKSSIYDAIPGAQRKDRFTQTGSIELGQNKNLMYSAVVEKAARDGVTEVDPMVLLSDEKYTDFRTSAVQEYINNGFTQAQRELNVAASRRNAQDSPYSAQRIGVNVGGETYNLPLLKTPKTLVIDKDLGSEKSRAEEVAIDGFQVLPNNGGIVIREVKEEKKYFNKRTGREAAPSEISGLETMGILDVQEYPIFTTRKVTDPKEYAGIVKALKRAELIK